MSLSTKLSVLLSWLSSCPCAASAVYKGKAVPLHTIVPDRPLVRDPIKTLLEYPYELGVWDFDPVHILILIEV
jgi:hypothetical protein